MANETVQLRSNVGNVKEAVHEMAARLINQVAHGTKEDAIEGAPEDTGFLKSKIEVTEEATPEKPQAKLESGAPYSEPVNFGHHTRSGSFVAADPFFTSAVERAPARAAEAAESMRN
ncbi:MAG TPA: HK97 gp10 family phage protein [Pyrinomonadaceae bacterium]|jgi:hypothetical protein